MNKVFMVAVLVLAACTSKNKVSFDSVEDSRRQVKENVTITANNYRSEAKLSDYDLRLRGDSTVSAECPQGDGWATVDLVRRSDNQVLTVKCSTVSEALGCMPDAEFKTKSYGKEDGVCNPAIPYPLPKIKK